MPFSPFSSNNGKVLNFSKWTGFSNSAIKIKWGESDNDSEIKFTYSKSKFSDNVGTPTFTDKRSPTIHKKEDIYNTPKVEQERGEANSAEPKSILNSDYVVTGRKESYLADFILLITIQVVLELNILLYMLTF